VVTDEVRARVAATNWMGAVGRAEDVAAMVCHLVGPDGGFITGQVIAVDGGRSLGLKGD
jgi:3-oxoacyl-[acyl-carrier protein] reductase